MSHLKNLWQQQFSNELEQQKHLAARIQAELEFAEGLSEFEGKSTWPKLIAKARQIIADAAGRKIGQFAKAVAEAEDVLSPIGKAAKKYTLHCIGHAHIDMNWMWSWPETVATTNDTVTTVLKLMDEFPDFTFAQSQASVYEILRQYHPALLEQVRRRIAEGRWEVTAVHWVEGDKNLASGEALARHLLYTRQFCKEHLGLSPQDVTVDWEPDTFGHAATIPSIIAAGGARYYYMCRGGQADLPAVFWWQGPDGKRILVNRETTWYNDHLAEHAAKGMLTFRKMTGLKDWLFVYGVGDHGGGPTRRDLLRARDFATWPIWPTFRHSTLKRYYAILEAAGDRWPTRTGELNYEFTGCYTTQSEIKKSNRFGENYGVEAESAASLAWRMLGREYPSAAIREAWIDTLFGQFHDILPGSGVRATRQYQMGLFQKAAAATSMVKTQSYRALAAAIDTSFAAATLPGKAAPSVETMGLGGGPGRGTAEGALSSASHVVEGPCPFVVFNPTAAERSDTVVATIWDAGSGAFACDPKGKSFIIRRPDGSIVPAQRAGKGDYWGHNFIELAVPVSVGPMGYASFSVEEGIAEAADGPVKAAEGLYHPWGERIRMPKACTMENEHLQAEIDYATGGIKRLVDKSTGRDVVCSCEPMAVLEYMLERPRGMSAWVIHDPMECCPVQVVSVNMTQNGPYLAAVEVKCKVKESTITAVYTVRAGVPYVELSLDVNWLEMGGPQKGTPNLSIRFPMGVAEAVGRYEVPFGSIERKACAGQEVPALRWADVAGMTAEGSPAGCLIANDCKYGHSLNDSTLRVTLLRSSHDPDPLPEVGQHTMKFAIAPHGGALTAGQCVRLGAALNHPLVPVSTDVHAGKLASAASLISCDSPNVVLSSVKKAQEGNALVVRLFETEGVATGVTLRFAPALGTIAAVQEVDLLERPVSAPAAVAGDGMVKAEIGASAVLSLKIEFQ